MPIQIPRREPTVAPAGAQARTRAATPPAAQVDPQARFRRAKAHCGACGEPWFGEVAFCPYCGLPSANALAGAARTPLLEVDFDPLDATPTPVARPVRARAPETRSSARRAETDWMRWAQPVGLALVAAVFVFVAGLLAVTASKHVVPKAAVTAPAGDAERSDTSAPNVEAAASTPAAPRVVVAPRPVPPPQVTQPAQSRVAAPAPSSVAAPAPPPVAARTPQPQVAAPAAPAQVTTPAPPAQVTPPTPAAQAAAPAPPTQAAVPAPQPGRNRALCSPASERAGLCSAQ
jgi:hypothetical protein